MTNYYTFEDLSKMFDKSVPALKNIYEFKGGKPLFTYAVIKKHRYCVLEEDKLEEFKQIIKNAYKKPEKEKDSALWTQDAKECYNHNLICKTCPLWSVACKNIPKKWDKPPMKWKVLELFAELGKPKKEVQNGTNN